MVFIGEVVVVRSTGGTEGMLGMVDDVTVAEVEGGTALRTDRFCLSLDIFVLEAGADEEEEEVEEEVEEEEEDVEDEELERRRRGLQRRGRED